MRTEAGAGQGWRKQSLLLLLLCCATGLYAVARGTDANWDLRNYHLYTPYALLHGRLGLDVAPAQLQSFFNPLANLPTYALVRHLNDHPRLVAFVMGAPAGVYAYALGGIGLLIARRIFGPGPLASAAAAVTVLVGMTGAGVAPGIGMSSNDVPIGTLILIALWQVLRVADGSPGAFRQNWRPAAIAGLLSGVALGLKLTNIVYAAPLGLIILAFLGPRLAGVAGAAMGLGFLACWAPFAAELWREFGSPVFPLYNDVFASPDYFPVSLTDRRFLPRDSLQALVYPFYWVSSTTGLVAELRLRDPRVAIGYVSTVVLLVDLLRQGLSRKSLQAERPALLLLAFCALSYAIWVMLFGIYRYLLVVESLSAILALLALSRLFAARRVLVLSAFSAVALLAIAGTLRPNWGHARRYDSQVVRLDPAPPVPPGALVILLGPEATAYLVPFMPEDVRVIGTDNNLMRLTDDHGLARRGREALAAHPGPLWVVADPSMPQPELTAALRALHLAIGGCTPVQSNLKPSGHLFCEAARAGG